MHEENYFEDESTNLSFALKQLKLDTKADGEYIAEKIKNFIYLETLELRGNTLGIDAALPIAEELNNRPELKHALWSDLFTSRLKSEIPETLKILTGAIMYSGAQLVELDLSDNAIGSMAMPGLEDFLASESASHLKILNLNNCGLGIAGKRVAECLIECHTNSLELGKPLALEKFIGGRNRLELVSTQELAKAFKKIGTLVEIYMPQNGIKAEGIVALADAIKCNKNLKVLNLNDNTFRKKGAYAMANALLNLKHLETVDFGDCLCRSIGAIKVIECLIESQSPIENLILSGNEISFKMGKKIIETAKDLPTLKQLNLSFNCFGAKFENLKSIEPMYDFLDLGIKSDDEGTNYNPSDSD